MIKYFLYSHDYLEIFNGDDEFIDAFCGERSGAEIIVTGDYTELIFHSDELEERPGFKIFFTVIPNPGEYYQKNVSQ